MGGETPSSAVLYKDSLHQRAERAPYKQKNTRHLLALKARFSELGQRNRGPGLPKYLIVPDSRLIGTV